MYPIVELCTGLLFLLTWCTYGLTIPAFKFLFLGCLLLILIVTDLRVRLLPDAINWPGFGIALVFSTRVPPGGELDLWFRDHHVPPMLTGVLQSLLGAALGSFLLWAAAAAYKLIRKRDGMGMGDVKMMVMVGAFLGVRGAFLTILLGTLLGTVVGVSTVLLLFLFNWKRSLAERAHRRGLASLNSLRWTIASQYQFPLGTFLGIAALFVFLALPRFGFFTP
jgi:leader peptidase (prepilin peptidase)/N-methyltransferase